VALMPRVEGILAAIVERTLREARERAGRASRRDLEENARERRASRRDFPGALRRGPETPVRFLCEIKKASPSRGLLRGDLDPGATAALYVENGASAISVVTEPHFFRGEDGFLALARGRAGNLPLLRKDFHVHEHQILEVGAGEADALLLLAGVLSTDQLRDYLAMAGELGLGHLVEVDDTREAEAALRAGARVVGVNNRDLVTFQVDVGRTERVLPALRGTGVVTVAESGIHDRDTVVRLERAGVDALLVGESLVTAPDPGAKLRERRGAPRSGSSP
jgi:indole-3-glycerol phosphate synthase